MANVKFRKGSKAWDELTAGLPESFTLTIDWDSVSETCDINRRNCAIHNALLRRRDLTRPSVGFDEVNFIWRGDARLAIQPSGAVAKVIAKNDLAAAGEIPWPTGIETVRIDLREVRIKRDLRVGRAALRRARESKPEVVKEYQGRSRRRLSQLDYAQRMAKKRETEALRGRFA